MANLKEIKDRIGSVQDTRKITNAMYLIASTKLRKAKAEYEQTKPYFDLLKNEMKRIFRTVEKVEHPFFYPNDFEETDEEATYGCLVITADKGLAGAYNLNAMKKALHLREEHANTVLYVAGSVGRMYCMQHDIPYDENFVFSGKDPTTQLARDITLYLMEEYVANRIDKLFVVYTDDKKGLDAEAVSARILPFHRSHFDVYDPSEGEADYEFLPDLGSILDVIIPSYVTGFIYSAMIASFTCEQNARMMAMNSADQNAEKILAELAIEYNRVRQAAITQEITEVSAGAKAQRDKRKKRQKELEALEDRK